MNFSLMALRRSNWLVFHKQNVYHVYMFRDKLIFLFWFLLYGVSFINIFIKIQVFRVIHYLYHIIVLILIHEVIKSENLPKM